MPIGDEIGEIWGMPDSLGAAFLATCWESLGDQLAGLVVHRYPSEKNHLTTEILTAEDDRTVSDPQGGAPIDRHFRWAG